MYLMSPGHPTDIGLQLGKACYPCSKLVEGECFYYAPAIFNGGAYSISAVRTSVRPIPSFPYVTQMVSVRYLVGQV